MTKRIVLSHKRAPGDTLVLTALVRDIALSHPGEFEIDVDTSAMDLWKHNPYLTNLRTAARKQDADYFKISYGAGIRDQNKETIHFLSYFYRSFNKRYKTNIVPQLPYPDVHLSDEEANKPLVSGRYWVMLSGGKSDFTAKIWEGDRFQAVADRLRAQGIQIVQAGGSDRGHWHPDIKGALNLVGRTNLRDMMRLVHHSDGVICGITMAMHLAAALQKPCVVVSGGREAWWWEAYVNENDGFGEKASGTLQMPHKFLHTIGQLDCCKQHGCWRNKVTPLGNDKSICYYPIEKVAQTVPKCMDMISVEHVVESVMDYYEDKKLPAIGPVVSEVATPKRRLKTDLFADLDESPEQADTPTLVAKPEGRPRGYTPAAQAPRGTIVTVGKTTVTKDYLDTFNHPTIGGKFTLCLLMYGDYSDMHKICLDTLMQTVPAHLVDLRIGSNCLCDKTMGYLDDIERTGRTFIHYRNHDNKRKYPVMRDMFYDESNPITTNYTIWFDDDTVCNRDQNWLGKLAETIIDNHDDDYRMYGPIYTWNIRDGQKDWIREAKWYHDRPFRNGEGRPAPDGNKIHFTTGSFWAIETAALHKCDIPDIRIGHNGGDYMIGEQLYQGGYKIKAFSGNKQTVNWSAFPRRGLNEKHTGCK
jgi:ADP-heptose:LPS heptosyltransferase